MTQSDIDRIVTEIDAEDLHRHRPEPRRRPTPGDLVLGAAVYAVIVAWGVVARLRRG